MHKLKTGRLLQASVMMGAACARTPRRQLRPALAEYGEAIGLAFQVVDDILDVTADSVAAWQAPLARMQRQTNRPMCRSWALNARRPWLMSWLPRLTVPCWKVAYLVYPAACGYMELVVKRNK